MIKVNNFTTKEMSCKCCGMNGMKDTTMLKLQRVRDALGEGININSAYRCVRHNRDIGGSPTSSHLKGYAIDITCTSMFYRYKLIKSLLKEFNRILIYKDFIHVDDDPTKASNLIAYMD